MALLALSACGPAAAPKTGTAAGVGATSTPPTPQAPAPADSTPASGWSCIGDPPDVAPGWKTEVAAVAATTPGALEKAMQGAKDKLRAQICVNADRDRAMADACAFLASKIEPWKTGTNGRDTCASAVVKRQYIEEWEAVLRDLDAFDARLGASAKKLVEAARPRQAKATGAVRLTLAAVFDDGVADAKQNQLPGGRRADWLASRFKARFPDGLVARPKAWSLGQPPPAGVDAVIVGRMWKRGGSDVPKVDVAWTAYTQDGREVETSSGTFPEAAAPPPPSVTPPPLPVSSDLFISMDSDHHGSICVGDTTQLWLKSAEALHVRVFDLYGKDGAMLLFPSQGKSDLVPANKTIPLGDERGFEALPFPGTEEERYLVIAAPTVAGLGKFASLTKECRLDREAAARLHTGATIPPGAKTAVTGYRVLSGSGCPKPPSADHLKAADDALRRLPVCSL